MANLFGGAQQKQRKRTRNGHNYEISPEA